jgi:hypothetical protein
MPIVKIMVEKLAEAEKQNHVVKGWWQEQQ